MRPTPEAAIFDLDGVVTFTARIHAEAWKRLFDEFLRSRAEAAGEPFRPFTDTDYRAHVDGRPRSDGVRTFLASRGITLPEGAPSDPPDAETVVGLGRRKDLIFRDLLAERGVEVDTDAVRLIRELRERGVRVGVASSSKNTALILEKAGLADLFDARVDGIVSEELGLRGKPAPDIFLVCLQRLGVCDAQRAVVVEDAIAGVEAGRAGGFGLVLGVDRGGHGIALREHGADWVVRDLRELSADRIEAWFAHRGDARPNAIAHWAEIAAELHGRRPALFLDYDGTLTPIVEHPDLATLGDDMRDTLRRVAAAWPTTVISGRDRENVMRFVGLEDINYAGSHGFDISGPAAGGVRLEVAREAAPVITAVADELRRRTAGIPGVLVEHKKYAVSVHYRMVDEARVPDIERIVDDVLAQRPELRKGTGKKVFELRPAIEWDKGRAVLWLLETLDLDRPDVVPLYIGDDATDEDAFRALAKRGIGILVAEIPRPTAARYGLQDVREVRELLERLAALREESGR